ncbi:MAG TPA: hypothetical protein VF209_01625 [Patescibacteria group bacterium]
MVSSQESTYNVPAYDDDNQGPGDIINWRGVEMQSDTVESNEVQEMATRWQAEREKGEVSWQSFKEASDQFKGDYVIVRHPNDPLVTFFDGPREEGEYTVAGYGQLSEAEFLQKLKEKPVVIYNACMDKRGSYRSYHQIEEMMAEEGLADAQIVFFSIGGGVVQTNEVVRDGQKLFAPRGEALLTMYTYVNQNAEVAKVYACGHDCRCGACAHYNDDKGVPEQIAEKTGNDTVGYGDTYEAEVMKGLIKKASETYIPKELQPKTTRLLAHFEGKKSKESFARFVAIT